MIVIDDPNILQESFLRLLENTKTHTLDELVALGGKAKKLNGDEFENIVYNSSLTASKKTEFEGHVIHTGPHAFPDIIAKKYFGIEVKMTTGDKWVSTGNSILESTRVDEVEKIYMFFGKFGGGIDIRYRNYQDCLYDIGVTHSPRYKIDMDLVEGNSIFDKMGVSYEELRKENNPINKIKDYYRNQLKDGEELWWIDAQVEDKTVSPIIKPFRLLSREDQKNFITEAMILFPEIFGKSVTKYERPAAYLITKYNSVSSSLRDIFTAGGQVELSVMGKKVIVPRIFAHLLEEAKNIQRKIAELNVNDLAYYWRTQRIDEPRVDQWKQLVNQETGGQLDGLTASSIYEWGLKEDEK